MRLSTVLSMVGLGVCAATFTFAQGCGGDDDNGGSSGGGGTAQTGKVPPASDGDPTSSTEERTFALHEIFLGEASRSGAASGTAWKSFGYNLDGLVTNVTDQSSPDLAKVCKRVGTAPASTHQDGDDGIDNAFGSQLVSLIQSFAPTPSKSISDAIKKGDFTILFKVKGLTDDAAQTNTGLSGQILVGTTFSESGTPSFSPSDDWPYLSEPKVDVSGAYVKDGTFVNGQSGATVRLALSIQGQQLALTVNKAIITFKHNPPNDALEGTIAGVIRTEELVDGIGKVAGNINTSLCSGSTIEGIKDSIRAASDMMANGTQDPNSTCDGISVGIGFTAKRVANPTQEKAPGADPPNPCDQ